MLGSVAIKCMRPGSVSRETFEVPAEIDNETVTPRVEAEVPQALKISVVTPSYNQGKFIRRTLESVLSQSYPALEYLVVDGGSTDNSVSTICCFQSQLTWWVSERDRGQAHAINKGLARATGEIMCWLNSDDFLEPDALHYVSAFFRANPNIDVVCGAVRYLDAEGNQLNRFEGIYKGPAQLATFWHGYHMHQPSVFWRRRVYDAIGGVNERLHLTMDFDYWVRMSQKFNIHAVDRVLSAATVHPAQKTNDGFRGYKRAQLRTVMRYYGSPLTLRAWDFRLMLYKHLLRTGLNLLRGKPTIYGS